MYQETIFNDVNGAKTKFTICDRIIDGEIFYYSHVINTELDVYKNLSETEKNMYYGMEISDGKGNKINYRDLEKLKKDILLKYSHEWLETEM